MPTPNSLLRWLSIAVVLVAGLGFAGWYGPARLTEAHATADWPAVVGAVVSAEVSAPDQEQMMWRVTVGYRYEVDGVVYRSTRWDVNGPLEVRTREQAESLLGRYPVGGAVSVYWNPEQPGQAVLEPGGSGRGWAGVGFGLLLLVIGVREAAKRVWRRG